MPIRFARRLKCGEETGVGQGTCACELREKSEQHWSVVGMKQYLYPRRGDRLNAGLTAESRVEGLGAERCTAAVRFGVSTLHSPKERNGALNFRKSRNFSS